MSSIYALERDKNITPFASEIESPGPRVIETALSEITCTKVNAAWADHIDEDHTGSWEFRGHFRALLPLVSGPFRQWKADIEFL
jgi:hypothetical protein